MSYSTRVPSYRGRRYVNTGPPLETVQLVLERDGYACVRCGAGCDPSNTRGFDWSLQHRLPRGTGGTSDPAINLPSNLLTVCGSGTTGCHGYIERYRTESECNGWLIRHGQTPPPSVAVLVAQQSRWTYLDDLGAYVDNPPESAA